MTRPYWFITDLHRCGNKLCDHQVRGALYCCWACGNADEHRYEIHEDGPLGHSTDCMARHAERGPSGR